MDFLDFGRYLTQQRELRGLSREDVVKATKIPRSILSALEEGQVEKLPARIFVLNYIRAYAQVIGLAPEETVLRFEEIDRTLQMTPPPAALEWQRKRRALSWLLVVALVAIAAVAGLVLLARPPHGLRH